MLVVEDDLGFVDLLRRHLQISPRINFEIGHATTLAEATARLPSSHFDVVLLDLTLPDSTREETLARLVDHAPHMPVVIISGHDDEELAIQALQAGAQDYFVKGQTSLQLLARVTQHAIERKRLELSLLERETIYRLITENAQDLITVLDREGRRVYFSPSYQRLLGNVTALQGSDSLASVHPDDVERVRRIFLETVATGVGQRTEYRFMCPDGSIRHIESQGSVVRESDGRVSRVVVVSRDITERRQAEESLRASEQRYKHLLGSVTDYIYTVFLDENGRAVRTQHNPSCAAVTGYTPEEFAANPGLGLAMVEAEDRPLVDTMLDATRSGRNTRPIEHRIRHRDGSIRWVRATTVPHLDDHGRVTSYDGLVSDVTRRRETDDRLRASEALYQSLVESLPQCIMRKDRDGRFIFVNQRFAEMLKLRPEEIIGRTDFDFYPPELANKFRADDRRVMESGQLFETEELNQAADGVAREVQVMKIPVVNPEGLVTGVQCIFWDVTASKMAQREIQRREELLQAIMDHTPAVIYVKNCDGHYRYVNHEFLRLFKLQREGTLGRTDFDLFPAAVARRFQEHDQQVMELGRPQVIDEQAPQSGGMHDYLSVKFPLLDVRGRAYAICGISTDITERKRIESELQERNRDLQRALAQLGDARLQLIQTEKLRAVGTLAAGVAHEVKNPLQIMTLALDGMNRSAGGFSEPDRERLQTLREGIQRADTIVRALLDYARPDPLQLVDTDVHEPLAQALKLQHLQLAAEHIRVRVGGSPAIPRLMLDPQKIQHVFINLITNAVHALQSIPRDSRNIEIRIATERHARGRPAPRGPGDTSCWIPGDLLVVVEFADSGPGIPSHALPRIFDPFFTTKGPGKGTGLGLHVVQNIVVLHGGTIEIDNRPAGGARARITFNPAKGRKHHAKDPHPRR